MKATKQSQQVRNPVSAYDEGALVAKSLRVGDRLDVEWELVMCGYELGTPNARMFRAGYSDTLNQRGTFRTNESCLIVQISNEG
jgi:hypothetical protein